jgi:hypothetical protein
MPALFSTAFTFDERDAEGIIKNEFCSFKIDAVLFPINRILLVILFESDHM